MTHFCMSQHGIVEVFLHIDTIILLGHTKFWSIRQLLAMVLFWKWMSAEEFGLLTRNLAYESMILQALKLLIGI